MNEKEQEKRKKAVLQVLNKGISGGPYNANPKDIERKRTRLEQDINSLNKEK